MFLEPAIFTAVQTYVPASSTAALSIDRLPSLLRKIRPFRWTYEEESLSRMNTDDNNLCTVIKWDKDHITGFPLWDQYLSGRGIPSKSMQGIVRDWPMPVPMVAGPWAKRGGSARQFRVNMKPHHLLHLMSACKLSNRGDDPHFYPSESVIANKSVFNGLLWCASYLKVSIRSYTKNQIKLFWIVGSISGSDLQ